MKDITSRYQNSDLIQRYKVQFCDITGHLYIDLEADDPKAFSIVSCGWRSGKIVYMFWPRNKWKKRTHEVSVNGSHVYVLPESYFDTQKGILSVIDHLATKRWLTAILLHGLFKLLHHIGAIEQ